jgi:hypothetical protein
MPAIRRARVGARFAASIQIRYSALWDGGSAS